MTNLTELMTVQNTVSDIFYLGKDAYESYVRGNKREPDIARNDLLKLRLNNWRFYCNIVKIDIKSKKAKSVRVRYENELSAHYKSKRWV
jgi:hypothetical protein